MSSSIRTRLTIDVAGQPYQWSEPFVQAFLTLAEDPAIYQVTLAASATGTLWDGAPLIGTFDFIALRADHTCHIEFTVSGGVADEYHFTLPLRGGGYPLVIPGGQSYAGQAGTESAFTEGALKEITKIRALNTDATNAAIVSILIAQVAA